MKSFKKTATFPSTNNMNPTKKVYLAGPMRGYPEFNFPAFAKAAAKLRAEGYEVFSPAEKGQEIVLDKNPGLQHDTAFRREVFKADAIAVCESDIIALMPGWEASAGARAEWALSAAVGLEFKYLDQSYIT